MNEGGFLISFLALPKTLQMAALLGSLRSSHRRGEGFSCSVHVFSVYGWRGVCGQAFSSRLSGLCLSALLALSLRLMQKHPAPSPPPPSRGSKDANSPDLWPYPLAELFLETNSHSCFPQWVLQVFCISMELSNQEILSIFLCASSSYHNYFWRVCFHKAFPLLKPCHTLFFIWMKQQREFSNNAGNVKWMISNIAECLVPESIVYILFHLIPKWWLRVL